MSRRPTLPVTGDVPWTSIDRSTAAGTVLANILESGALHEISNYPGENDEDSPIRRYLTNTGRVEEGAQFLSLCPENMFNNSFN
jgi:hypothetical protein